MIGLGLVILGALAALVGFLLLRYSGSGWRIGRLLAASPARTLADARAIAEAGEPAFIRLHGRIDSEEEFPGDDGKPIVYRRRRLQRRSGRSGWETFDDERLAVPFWLSEKGQRVSIDSEALGDGLVVVPRESEGVAADVTAEAVSGELPEMDPSTPVRLRIEQVSTVDHATAAGTPRPGPDGSVVLGPGLGRPLLLTTLDEDEAMRLLAGEHRRALLLAAGLLTACPVIVLAGVVALVLGL
ncbi:MAG: hypothetical protein AB1Z67_02710 [Candidatus Limnocylindrales bacterium]